MTTLHGTDVTLVGQDPSFFEITKFGIERSDGVTAVSEFLRRMTLDEFQIKKPIEAIPNFVDLKAYSPDRPIATCRRWGSRDRRSCSTRPTSGP